MTAEAMTAGGDIRLERLTALPGRDAALAALVEIFFASTTRTEFASPAERAAFLDLPYFDHMHRYLPALMQRAGWKTTSVPVNHRHRTAGVSKYNNLGRALVGIRDLRGVAWLITRSKRTAVEER